MFNVVLLQKFRSAYLIIIIQNIDALVAETYLGAS